MIVEYIPEPFPHVIIKEFFDKNELKDVWKELDFLCDSNKLLSPEFTGAARHEEGIYKKNSKGVFLESVYKEDRKSTRLNSSHT